MNYFQNVFFLFPPEMDFLEHISLWIYQTFSILQQLRSISLLCIFHYFFYPSLSLLIKATGTAYVYDL